MKTASPTDLQRTLDRIRPVDQAAMAEVQSRLNRQTKPEGSLGRLEEFARQFVAISGREEIRKKVIFTFAGDHGVASEGVSAFPREVSAQMVRNFVGQGAAINALARHAGADVIVVDMGVDHDFGRLGGLLDRKIGRGTANFTQGPGMSRAEALRCLETGIALACSCPAAGIDLVGTGAIGVASTTSSAALATAFTGLPVARVAPRGSAIDAADLARKLQVIERGLTVNRPDPRDPVDVLAKVGGFEIGGIAGLIIGCAAEGIPVVVDGFTATAGALLAAELHPRIREYLFAAHRSVADGHAPMLERLRLEPMLDLQMQSGAGAAAALAMTLVEAALRLLREVKAT
jgi:nicotinate-nucleotide--dimethylbenzimidazole phosphoribosyltransferase